MVAHRRKDEANPAGRPPRAPSPPSPPRAASPASPPSPPRAPSPASSEAPPERFARDHDEYDFQHSLHDLVEALERMARSDLEQRIDQWAIDAAKHLAHHHDPPSDPTR